MKKQGVFRASAFVILLTLWFFPGSAHAANVTVGCTGGSGTYPTIAAALTAIGQTGPSTITITGTCNENVSLSNARSLTFIAGASGANIVAPDNNDAFDVTLSQNIVLQNLDISSTGSGAFGVNVTEDSDVQINGCNIHDNKMGGVYAHLSSTLVLHSTTIQHNNPGDGLDVVGESAARVDGTIQYNGCVGSSVPPGCVGSVDGGVGVWIGRSSHASFSSTTTIQNNGDVGIVVTQSTVGFDNLSNPVTVQGHNSYGILLGEGGHLLIPATSSVLIQKNGGGCPPDIPDGFCGGIIDSRDSTVDMRAGTIYDNQGLGGIVVALGAAARLSGVTVQNNSGDGIHIQWISTLDYGSGNTVTGNGRASVFCDERSLVVVSDFRGLSKIRCHNVEESTEESKR